MKGSSPARRWPGIAGRTALAGAACVFCIVSYSWVTLPDVRPLARENPRTTAFMQLRAAEAASAGRTPRISWRWISYNRISPALRRAVLVTEDAGFWDHEGIDFTEIRVSLETSLAEGSLPRGASTITQQLAKNLYLSPSRNPYRKVVELMVTRRLEVELSKSRILELYLNVVEWGDGVWGADAAARTYFGKSASDLSSDEAALLAGALINPRVYSPARPNARLLRRQQMILGRMGSASPPLADR